MPVIPVLGRKSWRARLLIGCMYSILTVLGITMVVPFTMTLSSSVSNDFDYERFSPAPQFLWSRADRFCRALTQ